MTSHLALYRCPEICAAALGHRGRDIRQPVQSDRCGLPQRGFGQFYLPLQQSQGFECTRNRGSDSARLSGKTEAAALYFDDRGFPVAGKPDYQSSRIGGSLGYKMTMGPYGDWRDAVFEDAKNSSKNALYPLLTMFTDALPFEQAPTFDCRQTLEGLRGTQIICPEINTDLMATYLTYFKSSGFLAT